jgi:hypothetical protein
MAPPRRTKDAATLASEIRDDLFAHERPAGHDAARAEARAAEARRLVAEELTLDTVRRFGGPVTVATLRVLLDLTRDEAERTLRGLKARRLIEVTVNKRLGEVVRAL